MDHKALLNRLQEETLVGMSEDELNLANFKDSREKFVRQSWNVLKPLYKNPDKAEEDQRRFNEAEKLRKA